MSADIHSSAGSRGAVTIALLVVLAAIVAPGTSVAGKQTTAEGDVRLIPPFEHAAAPPVPSSMLAFKFADLAAIDPARPLADDAARQTLSLFGREDLIASSSSDYKPSHCAALAPPTDVLGEISERAHRTSVVIVNESHERSEDRGFIAEVAKALRPLGYDTLAMETLVDPAPGTAERYLPLFVREPGLPYLVDEDGFYLSESSFGRLGRLAKRLGYRLIPYEPSAEPPAQPLTRAQEIAVREEGQAQNLAAFVKAHPAAKLLIYVGYSHAAEVPRANGERWMAARLKQKTGIDPLTISQTVCRGGGSERRLAALPPDEPVGTFDLVVDHPTASFERHRPAWRVKAGDRPVSIPRALWPTAGWRVIEARPVGEPTASVPMDRVAIRPGENVALLLPPGRYSLRAIDVLPSPKPR